jgi:1-acyl-sn-glycerol-3-phosphate acyltransferase
MNARAHWQIVLGSATFLAGQATSTLVFSFLALLVAPLPFKNRYAIITTWTRFNLWWLQVCCDLKHVVEGMENIPAQPSVILCKHESAWETLALQTLFKPQSWVLKRELLWIPFFGWGLALLRPIAIDRSSGQKAVRELIRQGRERLSDGAWVVVFPEGTRIAPGSKGAYHKGGAVLAKRAGTPALPVAHNAGDYWRRKSFLKFPGTIRIVIGPPIATDNLNADEVIERAQQWIEATVAQLRPRVPSAKQGTRGPPPATVHSDSDSTN